MGATGSKNSSDQRNHQCTHWTIPIYGHNDDTKIFHESLFMTNSINPTNTAYFLYSPRSTPCSTTITNDQIIETCTPPHIQNSHFVFHRSQPFATIHQLPKSAQLSQNLQTGPTGTNVSNGQNTSPQNSFSDSHISSINLSTPSFFTASPTSASLQNAHSQKSQFVEDEKANECMLVQFFHSDAINIAKLAKMPYSRLYTTLNPADFSFFPNITSPPTEQLHKLNQTQLLNSQNLLSLSLSPIPPEQSSFPSMLVSILQRFSAIPFIPLVFLVVDVTNQLHINRLQSHLRSLAVLLTSTNPLFTKTLSTTYFDFFLINGKNSCDSNTNTFASLQAFNTPLLTEQQLQAYWTLLGLPPNRLRIHALPSIEEISNSYYDFRFFLDSLLIRYFTCHFKPDVNQHTTRYIISRPDGIDEFDEITHNKEEKREDKKKAKLLKKEEKNAKASKNAKITQDQDMSHPNPNPNPSPTNFPNVQSHHQHISEINQTSETLSKLSHNSTVSKQRVTGKRFSPFATHLSSLLLLPQYGDYYSTSNFLRKSYFRPPFPLIPPFFFQSSNLFSTSHQIGSPNTTLSSRFASVDSVANIPHLDVSKYTFFGNFFFSHLFSSRDISQPLTNSKNDKNDKTDLLLPEHNKHDAKCQNAVQSQASWTLQTQLYNSSIEFLSAPHPTSFCQNTYTVAVSSQPQSRSAANTAFTGKLNGIFGEIGSNNTMDTFPSSQSVPSNNQLGDNRTESILGDLPGTILSTQLGTLNHNSSPRVSTQLTIEISSANNDSYDNDANCIDNSSGNDSIIDQPRPYHISSSQLMPNKYRSDQPSTKMQGKNNEDLTGNSGHIIQQSDKPDVGQNTNHIISELYYSVQSTPYYETFPVAHILYEPYAIENVVSSSSTSNNNRGIHTQQTNIITTNPLHSIHYVPQSIANGASINSNTTSLEGRSRGESINIASNRNIHTHSPPMSIGLRNKPLGLSDFLLQSYSITPIYSRFYDQVASLSSLLTVAPYASTYNVFFINLQSLYPQVNVNNVLNEIETCHTHCPLTPTAENKQPLTPKSSAFFSFGGKKTSTCQTEQTMGKSYQNDKDSQVGSNTAHKLTKNEHSIAKNFWLNINEAYGDIFLNPHLVCVPTLVLFYTGNPTNSNSGFNTDTTNPNNINSGSNADSNPNTPPSHKQHVPSPRSRSNVPSMATNTSNSNNAHNNANLTGISSRSSSVLGASIEQYIIEKFNTVLGKLSSRQQCLWSFQHVSEAQPKALLAYLHRFEQHAIVHRVDSIFQRLFQHYQTQQAPATQPNEEHNNNTRGASFVSSEDWFVQNTPRRETSGSTF